MSGKSKRNFDIIFEKMGEDRYKICSLTGDEFKIFQEINHEIKVLEEYTNLIKLNEYQTYTRS